MAEAIGLEVELACSHAEALDRVVDALKEEGFGVLTEINIRDAFKEKLGKDFRPYTILGACNPPLAHKALSSVPEIGLMLPCNVTVEERDAGSVVRIVNPQEMMRIGGFEDNESLVSVGSQAYAGLKRVADALRSA